MGNEWYGEEGKKGTPDLKRVRITIESGSYAAVRKLLADGVSPDTTFPEDDEYVKGYTATWGKSLLHLAAENGNTQAIRALIDAGANVNAVSTIIGGMWGETPLVVAIVHGKVDVVRALIAAGADVNAAGVDPPLHAAIVADNVEIAERLIAAGANVSAVSPDMERETALHVAASWGRDKLIPVLVAAGGDVNDARAGGWTPLHYAACGGHRRCAEALLKAGADAAAHDDAGQTAAEFARDYGHSALADRLAHPDRKLPKLHSAVAEGDVEWVRELMRAGADVNARDAGGFTALHWAASDRSPGNIVPVLLRAGADVNAASAQGTTPLHEAAAVGSEHVVGLLLSNGASAAALDASGRTPGWYAHLNAHVRLADRLEEAAKARGGKDNSGKGRGRG